MEMQGSVGLYLQKAVELGLSGQREVYGDERSYVAERLQHNMATTQPAKRCPCVKGMVHLKASRQKGSCDANPTLIRKESELNKVEEWEKVLKHQRLDIERIE